LQRDMLRIAQSCQQAGVGIRIYTMHWEGPRPDGFDVRIVPTCGWTNHGRARKFADQVSDLLRADPVSLVVGFNRMPGLDVYFGSDVCFAEELRHKNPLRRLTPRFQMYLKLEQSVVGPASKTHLLLISPTQIDDYRKHYGLSDGRFTLLPPGLDDSFNLSEDPAEARRRIRGEFGAGTDVFLLLHVGSAFKRKGVDRAIRTLSALPEPLRKRCVLVVAGQGKEMTYRRLAKRLGVGPNVRLAGVRHDVPALMTAADVLLHPARVENTGLTLLEGLACGLPVLCTAACGYSTYIAESSGGTVLNEPFNQDQMNKALAEMLDRDRLKQYHTAIETYCNCTPLSGLLENAVDTILSRV
jgi:UDP-glucose:(heptosyl)LPS alpha-1,3-glucosyltransferase